MIPARPAIVTIGNFDGVHLGHQKLIGQVADRAHALGLCSLAVTFEPHPEQVLFPERKLTYLSSAEERRELLKANGMDDVWICQFTTDLSRLEPEDFMRVLAERQPIAELWVGADFALGRGRKGTISVLSEIGCGMGWGLHVVPPYVREGQVVSSTAIRTLLAAGAVRGAADLLGRTYGVAGHFDGEEIVVDPLRALPRVGPYRAQVRQAQSNEEVVAHVLPTPGRLSLETPVAHVHGQAVLEFLRSVG